MKFNRHTIIVDKWREIIKITVLEKLSIIKNKWLIKDFYYENVPIFLLKLN